MGLTTVLKEEVQDILVAVRLAADATAASTGSARDARAFLEGYHTALAAVAAALGLEMPLTARHPSAEGWIQGPKSYPTPRLRELPQSDRR